MSISSDHSLRRPRGARYRRPQFDVPPQEPGKPGDIDGGVRRRHVLRVVRRLSQGVISTLFLLGVGLPAAAYLSGIEPVSLKNEQRKAAEFPQLKWRDGVIPHPRTADVVRFPERFEAYYNDRFGFRGAFVGWYNLARAHGIVPEALATYGKTRGDSVLLGRQGWLYLGGAAHLAISRHTPLFSPRSLDRWEKRLADRDQWLAERGIRFVLLIAPEKPTIYPEYVSSKMEAVDSRSRMDQLLERLRATRPGMIIVDARPALLAGKQLFPTYYRTDSHWNNFGAFLAYHELMLAIEPHLPAAKPRSLQDFELSLKHPFENGDLARLLSNPAGFSDCDVVLAPHHARHAQFSPPIEVDEVQQQRSDCPTASLETVLVLHDSFFRGLQVFFNEHWQRVEYSKTRTFPKEQIESLKPQVVVQEFAERLLMMTSLDEVRLRLDIDD